MTVDYLSLITQAHLKTFRYSNLCLYRQGLVNSEEREAKSLELEDIFQEMVIEKKPGYCFQTAMLLFTALSELGFTVNCHLSKVFNLPKEDVDLTSLGNRSFTHLVLIVRLHEKDYLVDVGFAYNSLCKPMLLQAGQHQIDYDTYYLSQNEDNWWLDLSIKNDKWLRLYQFQSQPSNLAATKDAHYQMYFEKGNITIRDNFRFLSRVTDEKRKAIISFKDGKTFFKSFNNGSLQREETFDTPEKISQMAEKKFSIQL